MNDQSDSPHPTGDSDMDYERESSTGVPRWVKVSAIVVLLLALLIVVMMLVGGGEHGPSRHGSGAFGGQEPTSSVAEV